MSRVISVRLEEHDTNPRYGGENPTYKDAKIRSAARRAMSVTEELSIDTEPIRETIGLFESRDRQHEVPDELVLLEEERERLRDHCRRIQEAIEGEINSQWIREQYESLGTGEDITDYVDEQELRYYKARGWLRRVAEICEYADEHDRPVRVI